MSGLDGLVLPSRVRHARSPTLPPGVAGIAVWTPGANAEDGTVPLLVSYRLGASVVNRFQHVHSEIAVVAVAQRGEDVFAARPLVPHGRAGAVSLSPNPARRAMLGGFFNVDLRALFPALDASGGRLRVHVCLAEVLSNFVDVDLGSAT
ncbi:MAG TPA: hypothetical protein VHB21_09825 [Minicystis sp.]|nr:hypothetical protein [Minicystis sp.]